MTTLRTVITGANRGLGLEFCKQLIARGDQVIALARRPGESPLSGLELQSLACDVADPTSIESAAGAVAKHLDGIDLLINNAGVMGSRNESLRQLDYAAMQQVFDVNTFAPMRLTAALLPLLSQGKNPKVVHITSKMGSVTDNTSGGNWAYRMSKAALNMSCANMAHELRPQGIATMVMHPGWVQTDMGGSSAPTSAEESIAGMLRVIDKLNISNTGTFRDFEGQTIGW